MGFQPRVILVCQLCQLRFSSADYSNPRIPWKNHLAMDHAPAVAR